MINLVGNTCIASWITSHIMHQQFVNPFTWSILPFDSAYQLLMNFETISWNKFKLNWDTNRNEVVITVDQIVNIIYPHYKFDAAAASPQTKNTHDVYYNKIWEYATQKYVSRCKRLADARIPPKFIFTTPVGCTHSRAYYTPKQQLRLATLYEEKYGRTDGRTDGRTKLVLSYPDVIQHPSVISIPQSTEWGGNTLKMAQDIYNKLPIEFWE